MVPGNQHKKLHWQSSDGAKLQFLEISEFWLLEGILPRESYESDDFPSEMKILTNFQYKMREFPFWKRLREANASPELMQFFRDIFAERKSQRLDSFDKIKNHPYMQSLDIQKFFSGNEIVPSMIP